jgi:hypothetical protein
MEVLMLCLFQITSGLAKTCPLREMGTTGRLSDQRRNVS